MKNGSGDNFWNIASIISKLSENVKYIIICVLNLQNPDFMLPGDSQGAILANFENINIKKIKIGQNCPLDVPSGHEIRILEV